MEQINLFDLNENTPVTAVSEEETVAVPKPKVAKVQPKGKTNIKPKPRSVPATQEGQDTLPNILLFATQNQKSMWTSFKHRRDCMMQVSKFASFRDYGAKPMDQITARDCVAYREYMQEHSGLKDDTINRHLSAISACFRYAVEELQIMDDRPKVGLLKATKPNTRAFTKEQVAEIVKIATDNGDSWLADMVTLGCKTGMRQSEITALNLDIIQWFPEEQEIYLPPKITKTGEGRMVSLRAPGAWGCAQRLKECIGREFTHRRFYDRWWDIKDMMGFRNQDWFKFHATRHTAATNMAKSKKTTALTVAEQLGHASLKTTEKYYHGDPEARAAAVEGL